MITLTNGMRNALDALSDLSSQIDVSNKRLSTGRRVNSASDNAVNFFVSQGLSARAGGLNARLDDISVAAKTVNAATTAISQSSKLVDQAIGLLRQAQSSSDATFRESIRTQYTEIMSQIDNNAKDASYNGKNLINGAAAGNDLTVQFNETATTSLTIKSTDLSSAASGLNLTVRAANAYTADAAGDAKIAADLASLTTSKSTLLAAASTFGSGSSILQNRADYIKGMVSHLNSGADALTLADMNEEGANLSTLQTRQQMATTALSLANRSDQSILRLFG